MSEILHVFYTMSSKFHVDFTLHHISIQTSHAPQWSLYWTVKLSRLTD